MGPKYFQQFYLFFCFLVFFLKGSSGSSSFRDTIPFSTKYPELIIPNERVCLPRISCQKDLRKFQPNTRNAPLDAFTDYIDSEGGIDGAGPVELPPDADRLDAEIQYDDDDGVQAVQSESDNYLIDQSEETCQKDKEDYCDQNRKSDYLGADHTMCRYCGVGSACPYYIDTANNDLTGRVIKSNEVKELIVQLHNEVRSKIARGACDQPKAGCMGPVVWDDELARVAQKWADQCADVDYKDDYKRKDPHLFHDPHPQRKVADFSDWQGVGQNVARDIAPGEMGKFNATKLVGHWFRQIRFFDPKGVEEFGAGNQCSLGIGYYTQLVWQNTTHVGCGWSQFQYRGFAGYFENFLVCNYGPSANIWKDPVYSTAETTCDCPCVDCDQEEGMCPANPRYGSWAGWSKWGSCSKSCGGGVRQRTRPCRAPKEGGGTEPCGLCKGEGDEKETCNNYKCPFWSEWAPWSQCSVTCGEGERTRARTCDGPSFRLSFERLIGGELPCPGAPEERERCEAGPCPAWTEWTRWTECSDSCGGGTRTKVRECAKGRNYGECVGESEVTEDCNEQKCPAWTDWTEWTVCTQSCGGGKRTKVRECFLPKSRNGGIQCAGQPEVTEDCNQQVCPDWTDWSAWTQCTKTCGGGQKSRQRDCLIDYRRGSNDFGCIGESDETTSCNDSPCPVWTDWSDWTECSATCGGGVQVRARQCVLPNERINGCAGDKDQSRECNSDVCPVWTNWTNWTECSTTCGGGSRFKVRECVIPDVRNVQQCTGPDKISEECNEDPCPSLTEWSKWSECSRTCGGGTRSKRRECVYPRNSIKNDCLERLEISESCNQQVCPAFTPWTDWTECTKTCGGGVKKKVRECVLPKSVGGCLGEPEFEETCNEQSCPVWTDWTEWTECTKSCDGGKQRRERKCILQKEKSGLFCPGPDDEERECNANRCPIWTEWTEWTPCTKTCNSGMKTKLRECIIPKSGNQSLCEGESLRNEVCNAEECPSWTDWTDWTPCTKTCGGGSRTKVRECVLPKSGNSPTLCAGEREETEECNLDTCPDWTDWTEWTPCTQTCGGGKKKRSRECIILKNGDSRCDGESEEVLPCNEENCPAFSLWSAWTPCSKSCGGGVRDRERECQVDGEPVCECQCFGPIQEYESCSQDQCPEWGDWSRWSSCSVTCGEGSQSRARSCTGYGECTPGESREERDCKERSCPTWSPWGDWSSCSASCGEGVRDRIRKCGSSSRYSDSCPGDSSEEEVCDSGTCRGWSDWEPWSECSVSCGRGIKERNRQCGPLDRDTNTCVGDTNEKQDCDNGPCSQWGSWEGWSQCSASCGRGVKQRKRSCQPRNGKCPGEDNQEEGCKAESGPCPGWSTWGSWTVCSATCGEGTQTRERACEAKLPRLGLLTSTCPGASQDSKRCSLKECQPLPPAEGCNGIQLPSGFSSFNGKPANNVADCTWDYFSCTNNYGKWPDNKDCCDQRFNQCCMLVMNWQPTTHRPVVIGGYGPAEPEIDIDIENDLDLPNLENPIEDVDLGDGQSVNRPGVSRVIAEIGPNKLCSGASQSSDLFAHPSDCSKYISCQPGGEKWILNIRDCSPGTVFDTQINQCNFRENVPRCQTGRRARVIDGFETYENTNVIDTGNSNEFLKVFEEVNKVFAKQTYARLNVADNGFIEAQALVSRSSMTASNSVLLLISSLMILRILF